MSNDRPAAPSGALMLLAAMAADRNEPQRAAPIKRIPFERRSLHLQFPKRQDRNSPTDTITISSGESSPRRLEDNNNSEVGNVGITEEIYTNDYEDLPQVPQAGTYPNKCRESPVKTRVGFADSMCTSWVPSNKPVQPRQMQILPIEVQSINAQSSGAGRLAQRARFCEIARKNLERIAARIENDLANEEQQLPVPESPEEPQLTSSEKKQLLKRRFNQGKRDRYRIIQGNSSHAAVMEDVCDLVRDLTDVVTLEIDGTLEQLGPVPAWRAVCRETKAFMRTSMENEPKTKQMKLY